MSEYAKTCSFCQQVIKMSDKDGKWLPYNKNGSTHDCKKLESLGHNYEHREVNESMKWTCFICGQVVQKFSLVDAHVG